MSCRRRGFTMVELLAVMTCTAVLLGLAVGLVHGLHTLERASRNTVVDGTNLARLARELRRDAHAAEAVRALDLPERGLAFTVGEKARATYRIGDGVVNVAREHPDGSRTEESVRFHGYSKLEAAIEPWEGTTIARLRLVPRPRSVESLAPRIEAVVRQRAQAAERRSAR